jgi:hypothetical protein
MRRLNPYSLSLVLLILSITPQRIHAQPKITIDHNPNATASAAFKFKNVPTPAKDDAAAKARLTIIDGDVDGNGGDITALIDGILPTDPDQPAKNFFFNAGTGGGRWRMDLGSAIDIAQINTYSWHPNTRGPQVYQVWASDGADPKFNGQPHASVDPTKCGWTLIAVVDTRSNDDDGGQFGVSISDARRTLGKFRYLLFDFYVTETFDESGNTFYSEVDVVAKK